MRLTKNPLYSTSHFWWTEEDYKKVQKWTKVVYMLLSVRIVQCMGLSLLYLALHWDSEPLPTVLQNSAMCLAGLVGSGATYIFPIYRKRTSALLATINENNRKILKQNSLETRRASNRLFIMLFILSIILEVSVLINFVLFAWEFAKSGIPKFNSFLHIPEAYSVMAYVDQMSFLCTGFWMMSLCTFYLLMYIEFILRISFHFRVLAQDMRQLRSAVDANEEEQLHKLKVLIKDLNVLYW